MRFFFVSCSLIMICGACVSPFAPTNRVTETDSVIAIENKYCRIEFDRETGGLLGIKNRLLNDDCIKNGDPDTMPFRIYSDLTREFEIGINDIFQLVFEEPQDICRYTIQPGDCQLAEARRKNCLTLVYKGGGYEARLQVRLSDNTGASDWSLRVTNTGAQPREFMVDFPCLSGIRLGPDAASNLATAMDQGGVIVPAWERHGGVFGESNQMSMQWHAIWDPATKSALGLIFMDPDARPKRLALAEPNLDLHYFPPVTLDPGESYDLPPARFLVYEGDWKPAARAYRAWHDGAYAHLEPPEWFRQSNGSIGRHLKKGGPGIKADYAGQIALESLRELPAAHIRCPIDFPEYAFYCRASMFYPVHTDGVNIIREDMGGPQAFREGIEGVHRLGLHAQLYVDGYVVYENGELGKTGKAERWAVMHKDGSLTGPYSYQGFYHMCPGCVEWQDHLAGMVGRLLRETGADGIRIDSLGFYYLPCYNPAHNHETPFGYNEWIQQLLAKAYKAAVEANPNVLFTTEGSADWFTPYVHGALTSRCSRNIPFMRIAVGPYRTYIYATGAVWGSLSGCPGGGCGGPDIEPLDANWLCARFPAHEALVWGDVADEDPISSDPEIIAHRFVGDGYWAIVAARPACQDLIWPRGTGLADHHGEYTLTLPGLASQVEDAVLCDIETLTWTPLNAERNADDLQLNLQTNWALIILRQPDGPVLVGFDPLPTLQPGESTTFSLKTLSGGRFRGPVLVNAPGLDVSQSEEDITGRVRIGVPTDAFPGHYGIQVSGKNLLGVKRFLRVEQ
ncbi:MAG: DUF6259 domain-containing protein [bacterium]